MPFETTAALRVDLLDPGAPQIIHAVQDDSNSRKIAFSIYAGGTQWAVPDGTLVTVRYKKPDGTAGFYDTLPDGSTPAATIDGNVVTVALVPQALTVCGNVPVQIKLYDSAGTSIATFAVVMHVSANVVSDAEIVSSDYYSVLTKQIADALAAAEGIPGQVSAAQAAAEQAASSASAAAGYEAAAASSASTASTAAGNASGDAAAAESAKTAAQTAAKNAENAAEPVLAILYSGAGAHNSIYRGKNLGTSVTAAQWAAIADGSFTDLYIGDYWVIDGVNWRIAAFDYYYKTGDTPCTTRHVVIVPDANLYTHVVNDANITTGGYIGSKMYKEGLAEAKTKINNAFGSNHIMTHRQLLVNAVNDGKPSGGSWYDSTVELMNEQNVYGGEIFGVGNNGSTVPYLYTVDKSQFPLFAHDPSMMSNRQGFGLRDVVSTTSFAVVNADGRAGQANSSFAVGVRPAFSIIG